MAQSYLKPKAGQRGNRGVVEHHDGQFQNAPPYPQLGGFKNKSCLNEKDNRMVIEKTPASRSGEPI